MLAQEQHCKHAGPVAGPSEHAGPVAGPSGLWKTTSPVLKLGQYICFSVLF